MIFTSYNLEAWENVFDRYEFDLYQGHMFKINFYLIAFNPFATEGTLFHRTVAI